MEELRQKCFAEINRLESIQERGMIEKGHRLHDLEILTQALMVDTGKYNDENTKNINKLSGHIQNLLNGVKKIKSDIHEIKENSPEAALKNLQKQLIKEVVVEITTPLKRDINVDVKHLRKVLNECMTTIKDHQNRHVNIEKHINDLQQAVSTELRNGEQDKSALQYELERMQKIDRIKVRHANDNFYNADIGTLLPSIDTAYASNSTPHQNLLQDSKDFGASMISTERDVITSTELKGHCERFVA